MRVAADRLIFIALAALDTERSRCRSDPVKPGVATRLALAVLFSFSRSGDRAKYDSFWRELQAGHEDAYSKEMGRALRSANLHSRFEWILRDVGAPGDMDYRSALHELVWGPPAHPWRPDSAFTRRDDTKDGE